MAKKTIEDVLRELMGYAKKEENKPPLKVDVPMPATPPAQINSPAYYKIKEDIDKYYDFQLLKKFHKDYLIPFVSQHKTAFTSNAYLLSVYEDAKSITKTNLAGLVAYLYSDETIFKLFLSWLPTDLQKSIEAIISRGTISPEELKVEFDFDIISPLGNSYHYDTKSEIKEIGKMFFALSSSAKSYAYYGYGQKASGSKYYCKNSHALYYPTEMLRILRSYYPAPVITPIPTPPANTPTFQGEENLASLFAYALTYLDQGKMELTKTGIISVAQINKMFKFLRTPEIFPAHPDKSWAVLRTTIWAEWLALYALEGYFSKTLDKQVMLLSFKDLNKRLWKDYVAGIYDTMPLMDHLKGSRINTHARYMGQLSDFMKKLPADEWFDAKTLWDNAVYNQNFAIPVDMSYLNQLKAETEGYSHIVVSTQNSKMLLELPLFYANMFVMAAMGWVELAFHTKPPKNTWAVESGLLKEYVSYFEILSAIRITPLGAYVMGKNNDYEAQAVAEENVVLDENSLYISYNGENPSLRSVIEQTARIIGKNLYKVDYESVLGDCANHKQVQSKINVFQKLLSANPPKIWKDFFSQLNQKSYEMKSENNQYLIFSLPQNQELINTIAREPNLKKYILKAEGYMILIRRKDIAIVKKQLKSYGFLIDFLGTEVI